MFRPQPQSIFRLGGSGAYVADQRMTPTSNSDHTIDDKELVARCAERDELAWEILVRRYERLIYAIPIRAGFDEDAAADIFQQVFLILHRNLGKLTSPENLKAWLVTTTKREMLRVIRLGKRLPKAGNENEAGEFGIEDSIADTRLLPDTVLEQIEQQNRVRGAVENLDERCRMLITMLFFRDPAPSYAEIAEDLGISEGSIGPTRARCIAKITKLLN